jgi:ribosomal protein S7
MLIVAFRLSVHGAAMEVGSDINNAERLALAIAELADKARAAGLPVIAHLLAMAEMEARDCAILMSDRIADLESST